MHQRLVVSIASDIVNDSMSVELHVRDRPIIVGLIKDDKRVIFPGFSDTQSFSFEEVRTALAEFVQKMETTENVPIE
jgi:hypothetical protein